MDSGTQRTSLADQRYNSFMFKIQSEEISTSSELREDLKKMAKILKKRSKWRASKDSEKTTHNARKGE